MALSAAHGISGPAAIVSGHVDGPWPAQSTLQDGDTVFACLQVLKEYSEFIRRQRNEGAMGRKPCNPKSVAGFGDLGLLIPQAVESRQVR